MADNNNAVNAILGGNSDANDLENGREGVWSQSEDSSEDEDEPRRNRPRLLGMAHDPAGDNDQIAAAGHEFDFAAAQANALEFYRRLRGNANYTPSASEMESHTTKSYDLFRSHVLEMNRAKEMARANLHVAKSVQRNPKAQTNAVTDAIANHEVVTGYVRAGSISLAAIALNFKSTKARLQEFETAFNKIYDAIVVQKTGRNENHSVARFNDVCLLSMKDHGALLLESCGNIKTDRDWNVKANTWTQRFFAQMLAIRHISTPVDAIRVLQYCVLRNECKIDPKRFPDLATSITNHFNVLFDLCSSSYGTWLVKVNAGATAREVADSKNSSAVSKRNREEDSAPARYHNRRSGSFNRNQKKGTQQSTATVP